VDGQILTPMAKGHPVRGCGVSPGSKPKTRTKLKSQKLNVIAVATRKEQKTRPMPWCFRFLNFFCYFAPLWGVILSAEGWLPLAFAGTIALVLRPSWRTKKQHPAVASCARAILANALSPRRGDLLSPRCINLNMS